MTFEEKGEFKKFEPSLSETFAYVLKGEVIVRLGKKNYFAKKGEAIYFHASKNIRSSMHSEGLQKFCSWQQILIYKLF